ncbi:uncharacterized protein LOC127135682 [Lathyrus oleraceus]|uniref:Membrane protein of ER body-like protein n=1 Tax=Pisum sativum TaxID=3888 RepID=A0A9D5ASP2_PEA|nr:uncharacterized protein LOC127135682 [Pisum sativum]KAI5422932.1 hypothetical protein KIW84_046086 [Pisum sativum]
MEVINVNQWNNEVDDNEVEEMSLQRKSVVAQHTSSSSSSSSDNNNIEEKDGGLDFIESETKPKFEVVIAERNAEMIIPQEKEKIDENDAILPASDSPLDEDSTSLINVTNESERVIIVKENGEERQEFYLENVFEKPPSHGFYCPNCNVCIQKVYIQRIYIQPMPQNETIRCSSCFSFLIPIGNWLFPGLVSNGDGQLNIQSSITEQTLDVSSQHGEEVHNAVTRGTVKSVTKTVDEAGEETVQIIEDVVIHGPQKSQVVTTKKQFWSNWGVIGGTSSQASKTVTTENRDWKVISSVSQTTLSKKPQTDFPGKEQTDFVEVKVDGASTGSGEEVVPSVTERTPLLIHSNPIVETNSKKLEIVKSIVYGGLTESLASLSVVTSAASADAATLNIVALAIANLIGGLFALGHNLRELKAEQPKRSNTEAAVVDQYKEVLGERKNFILHAFIAILSFIIFGLIPPVVYGFTFRENDEKDFKLAAVAGASVICITLLSILKAYIKRPNSYLTYFQTVFFYVSTGGVATVLSYLAGDMMKKIIEKLGWFEPASSLVFSLKNQHGLGSY